MLSRKHYVVIARVIKDNTIRKPLEEYIRKDDLINDLCVVFARDNNLFNSALFRDACDDV